MKKGKLLMSCLFAGLLLGGSAWAVDFGQYSTEELSQMRGTMRNASQEEREAFRQEWQKRMQNLSPEERQRYTGPPANAARDGKGYRYGAGNGRGQGRGKGRGCRR